MKSCCSSFGKSVCLDRRQFLKISSAAAASMLLSPEHGIAGPFEAVDTADHFVPADKKLRPDWKAALTAKGEPAWYSGEDLKQIGMPVGGICAGQLYLAGDGRLVHWDIFNDTPEDAHSGTHYQQFPTPVEPVAQGFAIKVRTQEQTTVRTLDRVGFPDVRFRGEYPIGTILYEDKQCPVRITLEAFSPFIPLNAADSALPATIMHFRVKNVGTEAAEVALAGKLQNAVCCHTGGYYQGARLNRFWKQNDLALIIGSAKTHPNQAPPERSPIVLADFENGYGDWKVQGEAFGSKPAEGTLANQQHVSGFQGKRLVNTYLGGDEAHGKLVSPPFRIERDFINFLIGGGSHQGRTCMNLLVGGQPVRTAAGRDREQLTWQSWEVKELRGAEAQLEIVDEESGPWGHINIDQVEMNDIPRRGAEGPMETQRDFGTMALALLGEIEDVNPVLDLPTDSLAAWLSASDGLAHGNTIEKPLGQPLVAGLGKIVRLAPNQEAEMTFAIAWHFPNAPQHGNRYATRFNDAGAVCEHLAKNLARLSNETRRWRDTWYDSSLPWWLLDRLFAPVSILASATCQWWANGRFWAWEGVRCCAGTCAHVWNYEHSMARLFPELERSVREMQDFGPGFVENTGAINFRGESNDFWAADSQGGTLLKCLREHQVSENDDFLKRNWPRIKKSVEFLLKQDENADGLIEGLQHNTYDINFFGANTMVGSLYLGALRAAEAMARKVKDEPFAATCRKIAETGSRKSMEELFNGEYFVQKVDLAKHPRHQYAEGCLADQLFGQGWAHQVGLGYLYPEDKVRSALKAIWTYNWAPDIAPQNAAHPPQRWFARPGEAGLFTCTWPKGKHLGPESVLYRDEIWTGIEYQVAGHMAWEGMVQESLAICKGVHERYHPKKQNPWNEVECGDHYARAMASHGVFLGLCGFEYSGPEGVIGFGPRLQPENFRAPFTAAAGWGTFSQNMAAGQLTANLSLKWGKLRLKTIRLELPKGANVGTVELAANGQSLQHRFEQQGPRVEVQLANDLILAEGQSLGILLKLRA